MKKPLIFALCSLLLTTGTYATAARLGASVADLAKAAGASAKNAEQDTNRDVLTRSKEDPRILTLFGKEFRLQETREYKRHSKNFYAHSSKMNIFISKWKMYDCDFRLYHVMEEHDKQGIPMEWTTKDLKNGYLIGENTNTGNHMIYRFIQDNDSCVELALTVSPEAGIHTDKLYQAIRYTPKKTITKNFVKGNNRFMLDEDSTQGFLTRSEEDPRILALFGRQFRLQETREYKRHAENFYAHSPEMNIRISKWKMYDCDFRPQYVLEEQEKKGNPLEVIHLDRTGEDVFFVGHDTNTGNDMIYRFVQDNDSCVELALTVSPETQIPVSTSYTAIRHTPKKIITKNFVKGNSRFGEETY